METESKLRDYLKRATIELTGVRRQLDEAQRAATEPIAVVGMSCRYPGGGESVDELWQMLREGRDGVVDVPASRWSIEDYYDTDGPAAGAVYTRRGALLPDIAGWDAEFFDCSPQEALRMDPQQRLLMELVWEGMEDAGLAPTQLAGSRTGVLVGLMDPLQFGRVEVERLGSAVAADPYYGQGTSASVAAGRLAYHYDLRGPAVTIDTACSSSLVAVHLAIEALRRGECDMALATGVALAMHPDMYVQGCSTSMLAPDGRCKTFDRAADGYLLGEGAGLVVLEPLSAALENGHRVRAVLRGSAVNQDGRSNGMTAPSRAAQVDVIRRALSNARVDADQIDYVEAHGSGTALGDAIELSALHDVFGGRTDEPVRIGAVKTNLGHTMSAAGVAGLIKTVLVLENGVVPPNVHQAEPADAVPADGTLEPAVREVPLPENRTAVAGVSSFGWSGTNAHVVVEQAPASQDDQAEAGQAGADQDDASAPLATNVLPVSARSPEALREQLQRLGDWLREHDGVELADVARTLQDGRAEHDYRHGVVCRDHAEAVRRLTDASEGQDRAGAAPRTAFLLPGTGDQYVGLGRELYETEPVYAAAVDRCIDIARDRCGVDLRPLFTAEPAATGNDLAAMLNRDGPATDADPLRNAESAHPFMFTVQYALATLLRHWGVTPDVLVGYSIGEYVAACLAGVFSVEDAVYLVVERARLIEMAPAGQMVAVAAGEDDIRPLLEDGVDIAAFNGPNMTVLSGTAEQVDLLVPRLAEAGMACQRLRTEHAFHSTVLEPARDKLAHLVSSVPRNVPETVIVSNATGVAMTAEQATSSDYWADHLIKPVRFLDSVQACLADGVHVFLELGAGQTLGGLVRQNLGGRRDVAVVGTLSPLWSTDRPDARTEMLTSCARLWERGVAVDFSSTRNGAGHIVSLPTYPFQRVRYWPEPASGRQSRTPVAPPPAGPRDIGYASTWRQCLEPTPAETARPDLLVIFTDEGGVGDALAEIARSYGTKVLEVAAGAGFAMDGRRVVVDPAEQEHYRQVRGLVDRRAGTGGTVEVVHLWSLLGPASEGYGSEEDLRAGLRYAYHSVANVVREFGDLTALRVLTVSRGAATIIGADGPAPHRAAAHGLGRVAQHEYPNLTWAGVDLDPDPTDAEEAAAELAEELRVGRTGTHGGVTGRRRGRRWVEELAELAVPATTETSPWRTDGVYLITGGTRGLGMALARYLVDIGVRRLALVGRSGRAEVHELEAAGAEVLVLAADAGNGEQLRAALRRCREHFGALHGVVHSAGVPASGMLSGQSGEAADAVLEPKVLAMGPLAELVGPQTPEELRPELLVLYSSALILFGGIGESDYCAANTVLSAYGAALTDTAPSTRVLSVSWAPWQHDAWRSDADGDPAAEHRRTFGFTDAGGCAFLGRLAEVSRGSVAAFRQPMAETKAAWERMMDLDALIDSHGETAEANRFPRPRLRTEFVAARTDMERTVAEEWQNFLGIDQVGVHDPFFDLGGNSLVGMAVLRALEKRLETTIAPAVLFEHPTVAALAEALGGSPAGGASARNGSTTQLLATSSARGARRRRARSESRK